MSEWRNAIVSLDGTGIKAECQISDKTWNGSEIPRFRPRIAADVVWSLKNDPSCEMEFKWVGDSIHISTQDVLEIIPNIDGWYYWPEGWVWTQEASE